MKIYNTAKSSESDRFSSKRVISLLLTMTVIIMALSSTFFGFAVDKEIFSNLIDAVIWSVAIVGSEQFAKHFPKMKFNRNTEKVKPTELE